jgi:uncharacterized protein (TIGR03435 family)
MAAITSQGSVGGMRLRESGPIGLLIKRVQPSADKPIVDRTGIEGLHQWDLSFALPANLDATANLVSLGTALRDQLGLSLTAGEGEYTIRVIDTVRRPTAD